MYYLGNVALPAVIDSVATLQKIDQILHQYGITSNSLNNHS